MLKRKSFYVVMAVLVMLSMLLAACAAPAAEAPAAGEEGAAEEGAAEEKLAVGIVLPTKDEPRWIQDETRFKDSLEAAGYDVEILFSQGSSAKEKENVEALITKGVKVIIICPQDGSAAAAAAEAANEAGVKVVSYDRLIRDTDSVDYYVTFDSIAVGAQQAQYLVDNAEDSGNPLYLYAGASSDNNAFIFFEGAWGVLQPKVADGTFVIKNSEEAIALQDKGELTRDEMSKIIGQVTTNWDFNTAKSLAEANLTATTAEDKGDVFILAPNDGTARAIADAFAADKDVASFYVSGQDAEKASVQYIIDGKQSMTVFKDIRTLVQDAIGAAVALLEGSEPSASGSYNNGVVDVPAIQSAVVTVDAANVQSALIDSGYYSASDFTGLAEGAAPAEAEEEAPAALTGQVEVFSWWTGGGEAAGLDAMIAIFNEKYPDVEFVNAAVAGGAGTNARAVLATRLQAGDPPDSWQGHAGQELIGTYVAADQLEPLNFLYEQEGWLEVMPDTLIPLISADGNIYSVPVNIHRANVLWYNPTVLEENGIEVPNTWDEFFAAADVLQAAGVIPLSVGEQWTNMHLMETILLGELGAEKYNGLWDGTTDWAGADVTAALETYKKVLGYVNSDYSALSWQDASKLVETGDAAFNIMGDWANGMFTEDGLQEGDYGYAPAPGTAGVYQFLSDSFVLPVGAKDRDNAIAWLSLCGSKEGQDAFNPVKGSIPARNDADEALYNTYLKSAMADWKSDVVVGSLAHGVVANDSWKTEINDALGLFLGDLDVAAFQMSLADACASSGPCQ